jgi:hypothetical protein
MLARAPIVLSGKQPCTGENGSSMKKRLILAFYVLVVIRIIFSFSPADASLHDPARNIVGVADFNGAGTSDILHEDQATGGLAVW